MNVHSNHAHLGDSQWALQALYRMPGTHILRCNAEYVDALRELVAGTNIFVEDCSRIPPDSRDYWIASGLYESAGVRYRDDVDILGFVQKYFNAMCKEVGFDPCFPTRESMVCAWPAVEDHPITPGVPNFKGILFINCDPKSGQCPCYSSSEMDTLIRRTEDTGHSVLAVEKAELSLLQIGQMSMYAKLIVGCATGPWWPCQNVWNKTTQRICMLDPMRLDYGSVPIVHAKNAAEAETIMEGMGYL